MPLFGSGGRHRRTATIGTAAVLGLVVLTGGAIALSSGTGEAAESCAGLDTALRGNLEFIQGQRREPDALAEARIANRQAVVDLLQQRRAAAGCAGNPAPETSKTPPPPAPGGEVGQVVCRGNTLTLSAEGGAPGATSNQFPVGARLRITNLDNGKTTTVPVTGTSGSCALLNSAAFEQVREPGKFLIRRVRIERLG